MKSTSVFSSFVLLLLITSCSTKEEPQTLPTLTTTAVNTIMQSSALSGGNVTSDAGYPITARGICWDTLTNPTITKNKTSDGIGIGSFQSSMPSLSIGKTYYLRAYATNANGTSYGNLVRFSTLEAAVPIRDTDGNTYQTVNIGTQTWMAENLRTTRFRTSESISNVTSDSLWSVATFSAWCDYGNDANNGKIYGRLYNWNAIIDGRNITPVGWHIPTDAEWLTLTTFLGGEEIAGGKLKELGTLNWYTSSSDVTNETKFSSLPGGKRGVGGAFGELHEMGYWWTSTENSASSPATVRYWYMSDRNISAHRDYGKKGYGYSVRCIKDKVVQ